MPAAVGFALGLHSHCHESGICIIFLVRSPTRPPPDRQFKPRPKTRAATGLCRFAAVGMPANAWKTRICSNCGDRQKPRVPCLPVGI